MSDMTKERLEFIKRDAALTAKLATAEAKCWQQGQMLRAFRYSMDSNKPFPSLDKLSALITELPSTSLTIYIREQTNEVVEALEAQLAVPDFFHHISCDCGQCINLKSANRKAMRQAVEKALVKLKEIRGEK